jgi:hypothetical protein
MPAKVKITKKNKKIWPDLFGFQGNLAKFREHFFIWLLSSYAAGFSAS